MLCSTVLWGQSHRDRIELVTNGNPLRPQLRIEIEDGQVAMSDVIRAVSRFHGYDDSELQLTVPKGRVPINSRRARWSMAALNWILQPCVSVHQDGDAIAITVDRKSARNWVNTRKADVRWAWSRFDWRSEPPTYGIELLPKIAPKDTQDIVVIVHGLNSRPEDVMAFVPLVERANLVPATLRYPNDQPIDDSAAFLAKELRDLAKKYPTCKVRLLTHSMGGLVARSVVESKRDPGNVKQLIMIAPPNHGSSLASVATFMDCYECFTSPEYRRSALIESVSDGLGEATADLTPNSVFLDELNGQPRNPAVQYTILLGTDGPMSEKEMNGLRKNVREYSDSNRFTRFAVSKLNRALEQLDELVAGNGDGMVSCQRGKLDGVTDVVELPFSHVGVLSPNSKGAKAAFAIVVDRLNRCR